MIKPRTLWDTAIFGVLLFFLFTGVFFRIYRIGTVPGINGDEGWWGMQAISTLQQGHPIYETTTIGNPISVLFLTPLTWFHRLGSPSFTLLRLCPVFLNFLSLIFAFWALKNLFNLRIALICTTVLATAPTAIGHARFTQEPSMSVLASVLVVCSCLWATKTNGKAWLLLCLSVFLTFAAVTIHPTNLFLVPYLAPPFFISARKSLKSISPVRLKIFAFVFIVSCIAIQLLFGGNQFLQNSHYPLTKIILNQPWREILANRILSFEEWTNFVTHYGRLFSGVTIVRYMAGPALNDLGYDIFSLLAAVFAGTGFYLLKQSEKGDPLLLSLCTGWLGSLLLFFLFAGTWAIEPHRERYGLCLVFPGTLVFALGLEGWLKQKAPIAKAAFSFSVFLWVCLLTSFYKNYFGEFATSGGRSHHTFITGTVEPKEAALRKVLELRNPSFETVIIARQHWHFWPIWYLSHRYDGIKVVNEFPSDKALFQEAAIHHNLFLIEFVGSDESKSATEWLSREGFQFDSAFIPDSSGRDVMAVFSARR